MMMVTPQIWNLGQNIFRLFHVLAQLFFTKSDMELDYYHEKLNVRVASKVVELFMSTNVCPRLSKGIEILL